MTSEPKIDASLPPEIAKYLTILAKDPNSVVFAPLAEAYRKAGFYDEAIATAQKGLALHPNYLSGMVALGRAFFDKGMLREAREQMEKVLAIVPDNLVATNILKEIGEREEEFVAEPVTEEGPELRLEAPEAEIEPSDLLELAEAAGEEGLEEVVEEEQQYEEETFDDQFLMEPPEEAFTPQAAIPKKAVVQQAQPVREADNFLGEEEEDRSVSVKLEPVVSRPKKEITTETIAELYIKQGYLDKAIDIYQTLYNAHPDSDEIKNKLQELLARKEPAEREAPIIPSVQELSIEEPSHEMFEETQELLSVDYVSETILEQGVEGPVVMEVEEAAEVAIPVDKSVGDNAENIKKLQDWLSTIQGERRRPDGF